MRLLAAFLNDVRFQWRHRFYFVYLLVCSLYLLLLHAIPAAYKETVTVLLTFSDPSALGLIFAGGIVLLEKDQGIHVSLFVTPLRLREYLLGKSASLALLSTMAAWAIHGLSLGMPAAPALFTVGVALTSTLCTLLSIGIVVRTQSVNGFLLLTQLYALPLALPLLRLFEIGHPAWYAILPTNGSLLLIGSVYRSVTIMETVYSIAILWAGNVIVYFWAKRSIERHLLSGTERGKSDRC
ncbi:fluoroquinolone export ABC transporter permease subunit [Paenibacillus arenilitoris]|uniref:ABC transporter permease n=1 Tax=Paenibacillus arenilitoris TaxID=2772299 RepID=A0A927CRY7_9BACL|nr:ABC transporter permease [Paenibacillus arenilitoris]MBD2871778.1 ABC transporter permease [Paenibacillus arenilitoris]